MKYMLWKNLKLYWFKMSSRVFPFNITIPTEKAWLIDWLVFNGNFDSIAIKIIVLQK
jgi:hypothetical protein